MDCTFCEIVNNNMPSYKIYEDEDIIAILDIYPANPGHILILPKKHYQSFIELPDNIIGKIFVLAKYLSIILIQALNAKGINIFLASGEIAGQKTPHILVHLIPRYENDNINFEWMRKQINKEILLEIQKRLLYYLQNIYQYNQKEKETKKEIEEKKDYSKMLYWFYKNI